MTIWTAGFGVPDLAARSGLRTDAIGRLLTDETLTSVDDERIVAAGDAAAPSGEPLRMSCQAAIPLGAQAANTVLARIAGEQPAVINQAFVGQCISLGRGAGTIQIARTDDTALPLYIGGRTAATVKEAVCKGTVNVLRKEARKPGSYFWIKGGNAAGARGGADAVTATDEHAERFTLLRPLLFTIAYEILGSATEADDVLQDSYLRWADSRSGRGTRYQGLPGPAGHPPGAEHAAGRGPPPRGLRRPVAARTAAARRARRLGRCGARRIGVDGDAGGAGDAQPGRARGVRAARGVRVQPRRNRRRGRQIHCRGAPDGAPRPRARAVPPPTVRARRPAAVRPDHHASS